MASSGNGKLILPTEIRVCATCSYWDGERVFDEEVKVVVVAECCGGDCLVRERQTASLNPAQESGHCAWETLHLPEEPDEG